MYGSLVTDLGLSAEVWLFLSLLGCVTLFFKFSRIWSVRNLDLLLLFVLAPGMMLIVANPARHPWSAYIWLFIGSGLWLIRCWADLGLSRRPVLEPNLNAPGLLCLSVGVLGLLLAETISLPVEEGAARNPAEPSGREDRGSNGAAASKSDPEIPTEHQGIASLVAAGQAVEGDHRACAGEYCPPGAGSRPAGDWLAVLWRDAYGHCDGGVLSAAAVHADGGCGQRSAHPCGADCGGRVLAQPPCSGWSADRAGCGLGTRVPGVDRALVRVLSTTGRGAIHGRGGCGRGDVRAAGLLGSRHQRVGSRFGGAEHRRGWVVAAVPAQVHDGQLLGDHRPVFRLPVLIGYLALVIFTMFWPADKNLAELIALSAALLVASQFWYLDKGGTLVMLYLPLAIAMMFRPTVAIRRAAAPAHQRRSQRPSLSPSS